MKQETMLQLVGLREPAPGFLRVQAVVSEIGVGIVEGSVVVAGTAVVTERAAEVVGKSAVVGLAEAAAAVPKVHHLIL